MLQTQDDHLRHSVLLALAPVHDDGSFLGEVTIEKYYFTKHQEIVDELSSAIFALHVDNNLNQRICFV